MPHSMGYADRCKIALMATGGPTPDFLNPEKNATKEPRSLAPWIIAGIVVLLVLGVILVRSHHGAAAQSGRSRTGAARSLCREPAHLQSQDE